MSCFQRPTASSDVFAAFISTRSPRAFDRLCRTLIGNDRRGPLVAHAKRATSSWAVAEECAQAALMALWAGEIDTMDALQRHAYSIARADQRKAQREVSGYAEQSDDETMVLRSRKAERRNFDRALVHTPESAALHVEAARLVGCDPSPNLAGGTWIETKPGAEDPASRLEPKARKVLLAFAALARLGRAPTDAEVAARAHATERAVRRYYTDFRRRGFLTDDSVTDLDGEIVRFAAPVACELPPSARNMLAAYVACVRETGARPSTDEVWARAEAMGLPRPSDVKRPLKRLRDGGFIDRETGAVLRTLDGSPVPALRSTEVTAEADKIEIVATLVPTEDLVTVEVIINGITEDTMPTPEQVREIDRQRESLTTPDRPFVPIGDVFHLPRPEERLRRVFAGQAFAPWMLPPVLEERPRVFASREGPPVRRPDPTPDPAEPFGACSPRTGRPEPYVCRDDYERLREWDDSRERDAAERVISISRDTEFDPGEPTDAGLYDPDSPLCFDPDAPPKRKKRRRRTTRGD